MLNIHIMGNILREIVDLCMIVSIFVAYMKIYAWIFVKDD